MEDRRKTLGKRLARARRAAGYRSAKAFSETLAITESSVARAESGSPRVADGVFGAIEDGLNLPVGIIEDYLRDGNESLLERISARPTVSSTVKPTVLPGSTTGLIDWSDVDKDDDFYEFIAARLRRLGLKATRENIESMRADWEADLDAERNQSKEHGQN